MGEQAALHQSLGIDLSVPSSADDVIVTDRNCAQQLPGEGDRHAGDEGEEIVWEQGRAIHQQERIGNGKQAVAVMEKEIADAYHHLRAIMPQKLYHLKKTSTERNPERRS